MSEKEQKTLKELLEEKPKWASIDLFEDWGNKVEKAVEGLVTELEKLLDKCNDWTQLSKVLGLDFTPDYLTAHKVSKAIINKVLEALE